MTQDKARIPILLLLLILAAAVFGAGIQWGLPTRGSDQFLFGKDFSGLRLEPLTAKVPEVDASRGADVVTPVGSADVPVALNDTDAQRAQILCRYRLYSEQPDEMHTFRSLSQMKPGKGDLDPRLYQYGGLWIYSIGAIVQGGGTLGWLNITGGRSLYIGNPSEFGKFYIAARAYSAFWGLIGVLAVFALVRRLSGGVLIPAAGALCFICMPVVINMAHEAKPHLPGAVLILLAILAASKYIETGTRKWAVLTGLACGAAAGMVLTGAIALIVIPLMVLFRRQFSRASLGVFGWSLGIAILVYAVTNPYVIIHLFHDRQVLVSNLQNTSAMYHVGRFSDGAINALKLLAAGTSPLLLIAGVIGVFVLAWTSVPRRARQMSAENDG